ncbi:MAG: CHAP domain-containing protein [Novosphingobium sp.]|nr:CHAP domain-containing protein [Novosphingobium sp.]
MRGTIGILACLAALALVAPVALASPADDFAAVGASDAQGAGDAPYLQCVPYARQVSGIAIFGDAHTWWDQAEGKYARGNRPQVGAVMSFKPFGNSRLGHVAAVSRIVDSRTVLIRHANWSPINGRRGQIEDDVRAVDVSPANDWSEVRVWFAPIQGLGTTRWPLNGFIYPERGPDRLETPGVVLASLEAKPERKSRIGADFLKGVKLDVPALRKAAATSKPGKRSADPIGEILARVS